MKSILLAAAALIATPAIAQMQPSGTADQTAPGTSMQGTGTPTTTDTPTMQSPSTEDTTGASTTGSMGTPGGTAGGMATGGMSSGDPGASDPAGGYQPSTPPMQGTPAAGATVRFQAAPDPNTAYPPPAPMQNYPVCKKGQYDNCMQRGGK